MLRTETGRKPLFGSGLSVLFGQVVVTLLTAIRLGRSYQKPVGRGTLGISALGSSCSGCM